MSIKHKTIFLDIDGVVHPDDAADVRVEEDGRLQFFGEELFVWCSILESLVCGKNVQIVIHSTWRHHYRLHELQEFFPEPIRLNIIAVTRGNARFDSVKRFIDEHQGIAQRGFIVLDDTTDTFPKDYSHLILCEGKKGISCGDVQRRIAEFIRS